MAQTPQWKVYDANKIYQAACKEPEVAAAVASLYGVGSKVKHGGSVLVWTEGADGCAAESYDGAAAVMLERLAAHDAAVRAKWGYATA